MHFQITISGTAETPDPKAGETEIRRFISELGALALQHKFNLQMPVVTIPEKPEPVTDGLNCLILGRALSSPKGGGRV